MDKKKSEGRSRDNLLVPFGVYFRLIEDIKHYDSVQAIHRYLASTLLLASFAAIGFLYSIKPTALPLNVAVWVLFISIISFFIITILAFLDLVFQERLMIANIIEALKYEAKYDWLPKIHHRMLNLKSHPASPNKKVWYYVGCGSSLILITGCAFIFQSDYILDSANLFIFLAVVATICLYAYILRICTKSFEQIIEEHIDLKQIKEMSL